MPDQRQREGMEGRGSHATSKNTAMASFDPMDAGGPTYAPPPREMRDGPLSESATVRECAEIIRDCGHQTQVVTKRRSHNQTLIPCLEGLSTSRRGGEGKNLGRDRVGLPVMSVLGVSR